MQSIPPGLIALAEKIMLIRSTLMIQAQTVLPIPVRNQGSLKREKYMLIFPKNGNAVVELEQTPGCQNKT